MGLIGMATLMRGLAAQQLPPYVPVNPSLVSRSALYSQPLVSESRRWQVQFVIDYASAVEAGLSPDSTRGYLLDAELLQADAWITHNISSRMFVLVNLPIRGGYAGAIDGFLDFYHDLTGLQVKARQQRPQNEFAWEYDLPDRHVSRARPGTFIGDIRIGAGVRLGRSQLVGTLTLPTATSDVPGWARNVVGTSLALNAPLLTRNRLALQGGVALGWTPASGDLSQYQRAVFAGAHAGGWWKFAGRQAIYADMHVQTANYRHAGLAGLEAAEVTLAYGFLLRLGDHLPEFQLGMTEDVIPRGPAVDAGFTVGVRW